MPLRRRIASGQRAGRQLSTMASANIRPAEGPPTSARVMVTSNVTLGRSVTPMPR